MITRRGFVRAGVVGLLGTVVPRRARAADVIEIHMRNDASRVKSWFDPVGVYLKPGQTVRWILDMDVHSSAAYHPKNNRHSLRIPENAKPWDSGLLVTKGQHFDWTFTVEGVYDYFCLPHENDGMVGRIIVGKPEGPGTLPFDYFKAQHPDWLPIPALARKMFPSVQQVMADKVVHHHV